MYDALSGLLNRRGDSKEAILRDLGVWEVYNARHIIVHRGGEVDQAYCDATGATLPVGRTLEVTAEHFELHARAVLSAALVLMKE